MGKKRGCGAPKRRPQPSLFISMTLRLPRCAPQATNKRRGRRSVELVRRGLRRGVSDK